MRTIALTGAGGLIGSELVRRLRKEGDRIIFLSRRAAGANISRRNGTPFDVAVPAANTHPPQTHFWDPVRGVFPGGDLEGIDALIHLAGEPLVSLRWTAGKKESILRSREDGTKLVAQGISRMERPPEVVISASAVGYYGDRGSEVLTEASGPGTGFLAEVCKRWEGATEPLETAGVRTVRIRTGFVLARQGGALKALLPPFRLGVGGRLGSGDQFLSWIDLEDEIGLILHALRTPSVQGAVNATAPNPVTNGEFTRVLGKVLQRPTILPVPSALIRLGLGEMGSELFLSGQRALPEKVLQTGYIFLHQNLEDSLRHQLRKAGDKGMNSQSAGASS